MHRFYGIRIGIFGMLSLLLFSSCNDYSSTGIEDSVEFIESTVPVAEAQDVTMDLKSGANSFALHLIDLSNIDPNPIISNGQKRAWCIEWDVRVIQGLQKHVKLHSTEGKVYWNKLNYLLNRIDHYKQSYPQITYKEIQAAIWSIVDYKPFSIDKIPDYPNFPSSFYEDGEYRFDVTLTKEIIEEVKIKASGSVFDKFALVIENEGQIIVTTSE
ncbi:hypothetical protein G3570_06625 [Balneolaceae bacterium YR4-1]|uniref:Uncharacterized protein n=1 Tax=Halalkalibaculum roseum TaxID=2709311 RepID=A0A6M1SMN6_9BACT|nr:hypothetical protein [Halalkalibaculum roseum]NGP76299.1 hypothetical protein [Halalkalibaculum roseum]